MIHAQTLAFADYRGNKQYLSTGYLAANDRASLFLTDYAHRARLKIYVHVAILAPGDDPALTARGTDPADGATVERLHRPRLAAFNWNSPQHITPHFTEAQGHVAVAPLEQRLAQLEAENAALRAGAGASTPCL